MKNAVFQDMTQCGYCKNLCFGGADGGDRTTLHNIPEDGILQSEILFSKYYDPL
jgi:hypothetical protein